MPPAGGGLPGSAGGGQAGDRHGSQGSSGDSGGGDGSDGQAAQGPSDPTLENSQGQGKGDGAESGGESEGDVLDQAIDAMGRHKGEPGLETAQGGSSGTGGASGGAEGSAGGGGGTGGTDGKAAQGGDSADALNRELNAELGRFDGAILGERGKTQARAEKSGDGSGQADTAAVLAGDTGDEIGGKEGDYGSVSVGAAPAAQSGDPGANGAGGSSSSGGGVMGGGGNRKGEYEHTASANTVPADIPDGTDDDVVARQIREAAMKERDPELRAKLWDEYRKYVNGTARKKG
jgi:hypothetical protein